MPDTASVTSAVAAVETPTNPTIPTPKSKSHLSAVQHTQAPAGLERLQHQRRPGEQALHDAPQICKLKQALDNPGNTKLLASNFRDPCPSVSIRG